MIITSIIMLAGLIFLGLLGYLIWYKFFSHPLSSEAKKNGWTRDRRDKLVKFFKDNIEALKSDLNIENKCDLYCISDIYMKIIPYDKDSFDIKNIIDAIIKKNIIKDISNCCNKDK